MAIEQYIGVDNIARVINRQYTSLSNICRLITQGFIGVDNIARQFFEFMGFAFWADSGASADASFESDGIVFTIQKTASDNNEYGGALNFKFNNSEQIPAGSEITISVETLERSHYCNCFLIDANGNDEANNGAVYYSGTGKPYSWSPSTLEDLNLADFTFTKEYDGQLKIRYGFWNIASSGDKASVKITKLIIDGTTLI